MPTTPENFALWLPKRGGTFEVGPAPYTRPGASEVVVRTRAVGLNLVDGIPGIAYRLILPWLTFPAVIGGDIAGEIVEVGSGTDRFKLGDRVLGHALGLERSINRSAMGAFQHYVVLLAHMVSPIPNDLSFEQAAVLPLQLSTAATGLFQKDGLALVLPTANPTERGETVLIWGGSTGVGSNAIQLVRNAGYRVVATASPRNFDYLRALGADAVVDRNSRAAVDELIAAIGSGTLAGSLAIGKGSLLKVMRVAARVHGSRRVSSAAPGFVTRILALRGPRRVHVSGIWGGNLKDNKVGSAIYADFLPAALAAGAFRAEPPAEVVGTGLDAIPAGLQQLRKGVSAKKLVIAV
ncbi:zinc-binding alcohol dehydrogenase family protein [Acidisoma silvae]|uniref:Zinc-binding alcohol dehydrogenase family protein n=1 Tax=Acidisoma silvae TaxID=2802396 RepID=A0A964E121_9PROT|nr:zinc-binding alcohol dehydrogenase family protein [Acidisoma silvae]MCB8877906.1 zinc-binding alcohol dehydrogenase family protein [Acidisoma silvae]